MNTNEREQDTIKFCPICNGSKKVKLKKYHRHHLTKCQSCSFVYSEKIPSKLELDTVYNNYDYNSVINTSLSMSKKKSIATILHSHNNIEFVLDVGCGAGEWLDIFKENKCQTFGTEYNEKQKNIALSKGHTILEGGLFPRVENDTKFDLVILTEVIEHTQSSVEILSYLNALLSENGIIYITTPNFSAIERHFLKDNWGIIAYPEHLTYYTPKTLNLALLKSNYSKVKIYTENISLFRIIQGFNKSNRSALQLSNKVQLVTNQNKAFSHLKSVINSLLNFFGVGVSIVAIYKKNKPTPPGYMSAEL